MHVKLWELDYKAPSTRIRIFFNPQLFLSGFKSFPVHTQRIEIEFACPHASDDIQIHCSTQGSSAIKCAQSMRHKVRDSWGKFALLLLLCSHIGLLFDKRPNTDLPRHRNRKYPDSPVHTLSDSLRMYFSTLESGFKNIQIRCPIRRMRVVGGRIRKGKVADSRISGYVWTGPKILETLKSHMSSSRLVMAFWKFRSSLSFIFQFIFSVS